MVEFLKELNEVFEKHKVTVVSHPLFVDDFYVGDTYYFVKGEETFPIDKYLEKHEQ